MSVSFSTVSDWSIRHCINEKVSRRLLRSVSTDSTVWKSKEENRINPREPPLTIRFNKLGK